MAESLMTDDDAWEVGQLLPPSRERGTREQAPRSGQPWTDADYEEILAAAREGVTDLDDVARRLGRSPHPTLQKARRLLPVAERGAPPDRVMRLVRKHLEDPSYDWQQVTLEEPPPRPVVHPPAFTGVAGLEPTDLVPIAYALGLAGSAVNDDVVTRVGAQVQRRGLVGELKELRTERMLHRPGAELTYGQVEADTEAWLERTFPGLCGWSYPYGEGVQPYW